MQRIILLAACLFLYANSFSQRVLLDQSFGLAATTANINDSRNVLDTLRSDYSFRVRTWGFVYAPRFDLLGNKDFSLSVSSPVMIGFSTMNKYRSVETHPVRKDTVQGVTSVRWAFEVPFVADLNFGLRSASDETRRNFGFFAGAGYIYSYTSIKAASGVIPFDRWEPMLRAGIRMGSTWPKRWSIIFNVRGKLEGGATKTYGLQIVKEL